MDFIHTKEGHPVFISHADAFYDMRDRFMRLQNEFRRVAGLPEDAVLTFIIDRAIHSMELFREIIRDGRIIVITWQKGYKREPWNPAAVNGSFVMARCRNNCYDLLYYHFDYIDRRWDKNPDMRQIVTRAVNPKGTVIQVSIITNDTARTAENVIRPMFKRWLQENDFKYLVNHFGIDQITSYASTSYRKLEKAVEDRKMMSGQYKALKLQYHTVEHLLKKALLRRHINTRKDKKREETVRVLTQKYQAIAAQMEETEKTESRLDMAVKEEYFRLNTRPKALMDAVKILARNMFYLSISPFRELYDNYRDDHVIFRNLTHSQGMLISENNRVTAVLSPTATYTRKTEKIVSAVLDEINSSKPIMPDGSGRTLVLKLADTRFRHPL